MNIPTQDEIYSASGRGTHRIVQSACRLTIPAREAIIRAGGKIGPAYTMASTTPLDNPHLHSVLLAIAPAGLVYCQTPADWDPAGHLTPALRMDDEPSYPGESHTKTYLNEQNHTLRVAAAGSVS